MAALQRKRVLANGGLLEVHLGACQQAAVDFMFAAIGVFDNCLRNTWNAQRFARACWRFWSSTRCSSISEQLTQEPRPSRQLATTKVPLVQGPYASGVVVAPPPGAPSRNPRTDQL